MIFDKVFIVHWENYSPGKNLVVFREKHSHFLYLPKHARQEGIWSPFVKINEDIADFVCGQGEAETITEFEKLIHLDRQGKLWLVTEEQAKVLSKK